MAEVEGKQPEGHDGMDSAAEMRGLGQEAELPRGDHFREEAQAHAMDSAETSRAKKINQARAFLDNAAARPNGDTEGVHIQTGAAEMALNDADDLRGESNSRADEAGEAYDRQEEVRKRLDEMDNPTASNTGA